jgi:hypothetical protein
MLLFHREPNRLFAALIAVPLPQKRVAGVGAAIALASLLPLAAAAAPQETVLYSFPGIRVGYPLAGLIMERRCKRRGAGSLPGDRLRRNQNGIEPAHRLPGCNSGRAGSRRRRTACVESLAAKVRCPPRLGRSKAPLRMTAEGQWPPSECGSDEEVESQNSMRSITKWELGGSLRL